MSVIVVFLRPLGLRLGEDFRICAEIAGMSLLEQVKLLTMLHGVIGSPKAGLPPGVHVPWDWH